MAEIIRSWLCLNARCNTTFTAWDPNPACTRCGCVRVQWVPGGGHTAGTAKAADAELRALADCFNMNNINSAVRGERAKPTVAQPNVDQGGPSMQFAPGFAAVPHRDRAVCVPSTQHVNFKAKLGTGNALGPGKLGLPSVQSGTTFQARHVPNARGG